MVAVADRVTSARVEAIAEDPRAVDETVTPVGQENAKIATFEMPAVFPMF